MIITRLVDFDTRVKGMTVRDENGDYNVYINSRLSYDAQRAAYRHEMNHVNMNHFDSKKPLYVIEREAG